MSLKEVLKTRSFTRIISAVLLLASTALVYFFGFNLSKEFSSSTVLEYRFGAVDTQDVEKAVTEVKKPVYVERAEGNKLLFYFKNITQEENKNIDDKIGEKYQHLLEKNVYQTEPVIDSDLSYRYMNIFFVALFGAFVLTILRFKGGIKVVQLIGMNFTFLLSFVFELAVILGFISLAGLANARLDVTAVQGLLFLFVVSFFIKFILSMGVYEKVKERKDSLLEAWNSSVKESKKFLIESAAFTTFIFILLFILVPEFRFVLAIGEVGLLLAGFTTFKLIPELLSFKLRNK